MIKNLTCALTGRPFTLPRWTRKWPQVEAYAEQHAGFREACHIVPARNLTPGAAYLRSRLVRDAVEYANSTEVVTTA